MKDAELTPDPRKKLYAEAIAVLEPFKRNNRELFESDPKGSRQVLRKALARVFRLKPGPKPQRNPAIAKAARERGRGVPWKELYPRYVEGWARLTEYTRGLAEEGFRSKVNTYLRDHRRLKFPQAKSENNTVAGLSE